MSEGMAWGVIGAALQKLPGGPKSASFLPQRKIKKEAAFLAAAMPALVPPARPKPFGEAKARASTPLTPNINTWMAGP
jgi:hypothetical protein